MKINVNEDRCFGCGGCVASMDNIFDFNDEGRAYVKVDEVTGDEDVNKVKEFVDNKYCPGDAISYEE